MHSGVMEGVLLNKVMQNEGRNKNDLTLASSLSFSIIIIILQNCLIFLKITYSIILKNPNFSNCIIKNQLHYQKPMWIFPVNIISTFYFLQKFVNIINQKRNEVKKVYLRTVLCSSE